MTPNNDENKSTAVAPGIRSVLSCRLLGAAHNLALGRFPEVLQVETTNACNSKCLICPHRTMKRRVESMADDLYARIIDEAAAHRCGNVHLHNFGEPLLDRKLAERIRYAKAKGLKRVKIFSNGSLLDGERAHELIEAGLDEIKISFDGATREEFERIRQPLKFDTVIDNIKELVRIRDQKKAGLKIMVACCSTADKTETIRTLESMVDQFSFGRVHNWASPEESHGRSGIRRPCSRVWRTFTVLANGDVSLCCLDYEGEVILGNVREDSIARIWRNTVYRRIRSCHRLARQDLIKICRNCTKSFW